MIRLTALAGNNDSSIRNYRIHCCADALPASVFARPGPRADMIYWSIRTKRIGQQYRLNSLTGGQSGLRIVNLSGQHPISLFLSAIGSSPGGPAITSTNQNARAGDETNQHRHNELTSAPPKSNSDLSVHLPITLNKASKLLTMTSAANTPAGTKNMVR